MTATMTAQDTICNVKPPTIWAGKSIFTVANNKGGHYTYMVQLKKADGQYQDTWFVKLLTGPDNTRDYTYMGMLAGHSWYSDGQNQGAPFAPFLKLTTKSKYNETSMPVQVFDFAMRVIHGRQALPMGYSIQHNGHCSMCGRQLTDPESLMSGIGPVCASK